MTPPEFGYPGLPGEGSCGSAANTGKAADDESTVESSRPAESRHGQDVGLMLKKFRRQDRITTLALGSGFLTLFATLAVWTWHYSQ